MGRKAVDPIRLNFDRHPRGGRDKPRGAVDFRAVRDDSRRQEIVIARSAIAGIDEEIAAGIETSSIADESDARIVGLLSIVRLITVCSLVGPYSSILGAVRHTGFAIAVSFPRWRFALSHSCV
mgnify:CR=1 FL=1